MFEYTAGGVPIKIWVPENEYYGHPDLAKQMGNLSRLPDAFHHVALMPDGHPGMGMPIGGVLACRENVVPAAVGVDIGCGMAWALTDLDADSVDVQEIIEEVYLNVPVGFAGHDHSDKMPEALEDEFEKVFRGFFGHRDYNEWPEKARSQLGTLGGGNHFIELQKDSNGKLSVMLHSGSRNIGLRIAKMFIKEAADYCKE